MVGQAQQIKEILFTQRFVLAPEAQRLGIVNRVVPLQDLMPEALKLARVMALGDGYHLWMMKKMVNAAQDAAGLPAHVRAGLDTVRHHASPCVTAPPAKPLPARGSDPSEH